MVPLHRREVLGLLGTGAAGAMISALGCGGSAPVVRRAPQLSGEVRSWLQDAVARLAATYPVAHALAVTRRRTTAARDVLGAGVSRQHSDGAVLTVRDPSGAWREYVTSDLSRSGIAAAANALDAAQRPRSVDFGPAPTAPAEPLSLDELDLQRRVERLLVDDPVRAPRIVYAAAAIDVDDATVWSVAPGRDLAQRLVRIRHTAVRAAWNGTRPVVRDATRAWTGSLDDQTLTPDQLAAASDAVLEVITPGRFDDGVRTVVLDPSIVALVIDTLTRDLLTAGTTARADSAPLASHLVTLVDDPTSPGAYGGFAFDDEGELAAPLTLLDAGRITARLADRATGGSGRGRRPGHTGPIAPAPSHLRLVPGAADLRQLYGDGFALEAGITATIDSAPGHDPDRARLRIACARARELKAGNPTGRLYADVELVAPLRDLLGHIDAVAATPVAFAPSDADPWRSIAAPAVRTRGLVRATRGG